MSNHLYNKKSKEDLVNQIDSEDFNRITLSMYKYTRIDNLDKLRDSLYSDLSSMKVLGRIYISEEGINAQISVPEFNESKLTSYINSLPFLKKVMIKRAIEEGKSFYKLIIKVKKEIVAYGLNKQEYDINVVGKHLSPSEFNKAIEDPNSIVVDIRNYYESEVGRFEKAIVPNVERSQELLYEVRKILKGKENDKILLYCTGGIRCEKASSFLLNNSFKDVNQLDGGIINYANAVKEKKISSKFKGKNFVFDNRMGERITDDVISNCHQCRNKSDYHRNCSNNLCHILFIQCYECNKKFDGCCCEECNNYKNLPKEEKLINKNSFIKWNNKRLNNRIKPKLNEISS